jgi:hypothetical protein
MLLFEAPRNALATEVLKDHYAAIVGLPAAASVSFILVVLLRQTDGPIEFEGLGFKFRGASGQVAMWVICFLAFAVAIKLCWELPRTAGFQPSGCVPTERLSSSDAGLY